MMMPCPCPSGSRLLKTFFESKNLVHHDYNGKMLDLKKVFSNLEPVGQGRGIIMGLTRLLLLGPFYTIQTNFMYFFALLYFLLFGNLQFK